MKIGIDAGALGGKKPFVSGNFQLADRLIFNLCRLNRKITFVLYSMDPINSTIMMKYGNNVINKIVKPRRFWNSLGLSIELLVNPVDLFLGLNQHLPLFNVTKSVIFILDLAYKIYPELFNNKHKISLMTRLAIKKADAVIAISASTKKDIIRYCNFNKKEIKVIYPGI